MSEWTEEEWQTKEGSGNAKKEDGTEKRYLPKKAWEQMSEKEKEETEEKKLEGSKEGKQHVGNTKKAKDSRKKASKEGEKDEEKDANEEEEEEEEADVKKDVEDDSEAEYQDGVVDDEEVEDDDDNDAENQEDGEEAKAGGKKRTRGQQNGSNKSQKDNSGKAQSKSNGSKNPSQGQSKNETDESSNGDKKGTVGSKHMKDEDPAPKGSADRLPKKGQAAHWKSLPGFVQGKVEDIITEAQKVNGKNVKASENDPRIVLKSDASGKICVHKPEACYYE